MRSSIATNGMSNKLIAYKLYNYIDNNETDKFNVLLEEIATTIAKAESLAKDQSLIGYGLNLLISVNSQNMDKGNSTQWDLDFILNKWVFEGSDWPLIVNAAFHNNTKIVETLIKYKVKYFFI